MKAAHAIHGLYAVTPDEADTAQLLVLVGAALAGGARLVQYRNKKAETALRLAQAKALKALCQAFEVPLIINDHLDLALAVDADGLHIGTNDGIDQGNVAATRKALGHERILGVSCYNQLALAATAAEAGASYVAFGSVFASGTKPQAVTASLELFAQAKSLKLPLVGIGGITVSHLPQLIRAGADSAAVIGDLFQATDVEQRARELSRCFSQCFK